MRDGSRRPSRSPAEPTVVQVDDEGLVLGDVGDRDVAVDVVLDGQRVWSFWTLRDTREDGRDRHVRWPAPLRGHLHGTTALRVAEHVSGRTMLDREQRFGSGEGRVRVVDGAGNPLGIDKSGHLTRTFEHRESWMVAPLLDSIQTVLGVLDQAGVEAFVAYGTLLGAVREGRLIGHDSDADLGYVSRHRHPVDVCRESFELQRRVEELGLATMRYSGCSFKIDVEEADGSRRGLDLFGGFVAEGSEEDGTLYLMGEVGTPFRRSWVHPLGTATLEGREVPVPARPEKLLEAMYGPGWRVPDPTFAFDREDEAHVRLGEWFRGLREQRNKWDRWYSTSWRSEPLPRPHELARILHRRRPGAFVLDAGCGRGQDAVWLAERGHEVWAVDYTARCYDYLATRSAERELPLRFHPVNLLSLRHTMAWGARLARVPGPKVIVARHVIDCVPERGLRGLLQLARMGLGSGGALFCEFFVDEGRREHEPSDLIWELHPDEVDAEIAAAGGRVRWSTDFRPRGPHELPAGSVRWDHVPLGRRMVIEW